MSLFDSHYYAGGKKVCNLLGAYANRKDILISMIPKPTLEKGKYPGAFVFPPDKGLTPNPIKLLKIEQLAKQYRENTFSEAKQKIYEKIVEALKDFTPDRPVTGLDFSSLYPSLIMTYNLSPEKIILDHDEAMMYKEMGYPVYAIDFMYGSRKVNAWSILHNNDETKIGLYPSVLIDLFNKRAEMKKILAKYKSIREVMDGIYGYEKKINPSGNLLKLKDAIWEIRAESINELTTLQNEEIVVSVGGTLEEEKEDNKRKMKIIKDRLSILDDLLALDNSNDLLALDNSTNPADSTNSDALTAEYIEKYKQYYDNAIFECNCANVKQNAIKIYMNTFYGEAGNSLSPFFLLELAGAVTSSGQYNIKLVAKFVQDKGFHIKYGDTDSLYLVPPPVYFSECDMQFIENKLTREEYWSAMVRITMRVMNSLKTEVNDYLYSDNGSKYLKMAYEEVLYPVVFTGKKKYYGIAHENEINFNPSHLFIRGIDIIKQGQSGLAKTIGNRIMWESMSISNNKTVRQIVEDVITDAVVNKDQWEFDNFIKSDAWRPNKQNISVHIFMKRMKIYADIENQENQKKLAMGINSVRTLYELPEAGERFNYVIVKKDSISDMFDIHGRKIAIKKGDRMEFIAVAKDKNLPIDIVFYMINYVVGICARFINYDDEFQMRCGSIGSGSTSGSTSGGDNSGESGCSDSQIDDEPNIEKKMDEYSQKMAKKYLEGLIKRLENIDSAVLRQQGTIYKKAYLSVIKQSKELLSPLISNLFHGKIINYEIFINNTDTLYDTICNNISQFIEKQYTIKTKCFCDHLMLSLNIVNSGGINSTELYKWHPFINQKMNAALSAQPNSNIFNDVIDGLNTIAIKYENILTEKINSARMLRLDEGHSDDKDEGRNVDKDKSRNVDNVKDHNSEINFMELINDQEHLIIKRFIQHLFDIYGNLKYKFKKHMLAKHLNGLKANLLNTTIKPSNMEKNKAIRESANKFYPICGNVDV
jgi:DNA polymerase elongation subunit (family B)